MPVLVVDAVALAVDAAALAVDAAAVVVLAVDAADVAVVMTGKRAATKRVSLRLIVVRR